MRREFRKSTLREYFESIVIAVILALFIRILGPRLHQALLFLFLFFTIPFILLHAVLKRLAPSHPRSILAFIVACAACAAW